MRIVYNFILYYIIVLFIMSKSFTSLGDFQAKFYSNYLNDSKLKKSSSKKKAGARKIGDQYTKEEIKEHYANLDNQAREIARRTRDQNLKIKLALDQQRARQNRNRTQRVSQRNEARRLREEQSRLIADIKARQRDLMNQRRRNR